MKKGGCDLSAWFNASLARGAAAEVTRFLELNPMAPVAAGLLVGTMISLRTHSLMDSGPLFFSLLPLFSLVLVFPLSRTPVPVKHIMKFAFSVVAGSLSAQFALTPSADHYARLTEERDVGAEIEMIVTDPTATGETLPWLTPPRLLKCEILRMRMSRTDLWRKASGTTFARMPRKTRPLAYGEKVVLSGAFIKPPPPAFDGDFDFSRHLLSKGVPMLFKANMMESQSRSVASSLNILAMSSLLALRNALLSKLTDGMPPDDKRTLAALMFGCRQGVDYEDRRKYLRSGIIHIFAISGLHVGMLAMTIFLLLRWLPFRVRYFAAPALLALYTMTTGMQASAVRALLMIGAWSIMRGCLHRTSALNVVFLAAAVILLTEPLSMMGAGFQYSFTIAAFLVLSWRSVESWQTLLAERRRWAPSGTKGFRAILASKTIDHIFNAMATTVVAWLAGTSLTLLYRSYFIPGAALTNLLVVPMVWLLFAAAAVQIVVLPLQGLFSLSPFLQGLLATVKSAASIGAYSGGGFNLPTPSLWSVTLFLAALALLLSTRKVFTFGAALSVLTGVVVFWLYSPRDIKETIAFVNGGDSDQPAIVHIPEGMLNGTTVVNPGSKERCRAILGFLATQGANSIDRMLFTANRKPRLGGAGTLLAGTTVRHIVFPSGFRRSRFAKFAMKKARSQGVFVSILQPENDMKDSEKNYKSPSLTFTTTANGGSEARWDSPGSNAIISLRPTVPGEALANAGFTDSPLQSFHRKILISNTVSFEIITKNR
ncbi:MAG: ComEC/Rec2 family competence protein [Victivallales bacterium]|nr:ComEC/Rec2 family competence protein [Victivallales bacterium]